MRQRFRPLRARVMARRPGEDGRSTLSPRERRLLGWIAAIVLVIGIALVVGLLGGNGDGTPLAPGESASPGTDGLPPIALGTAIDASTGEVADGARTDRFTAGDTFAYSLRPAGELPPAIYVEVERTGGGEPEIVQTATAANAQPITPGRPAIAFNVAADILLAEWGPGQYRMRVFTEPGGDPIAEGSFTLVGDVMPPSTAPSASP